MADMTMLVRCYVSSPVGWIDINDHQAYELADGTRATRTVSQRRTEVTSKWLPGSYVVSSVPNNVEEAIVVWVFGEDHHILAKRVSALEVAFGQLSYAVRWVQEEHTEIWQCMAADVTIETTREFQHARRARVQMSVPRLPEPVMERYQIPGPSIVPR